MSHSVNVHHKLDGMILIGSEFRFVLPLDLKLKKRTGLKVRRVNKSTFKGISEYTAGEDGYSITFGETFSLPLAFLVNIRNRAVCRFNELTFKNAYVESVKEVLCTSMVGSRTARSFNMEFPVIPDSVYPNDITRFLKVLTRKLESKCQILADGCDLMVRCLGFKMGMDINWLELGSLLYPFNLANLDEAVLHYAQDYVVTGHIVLWDKNAKQLFPNGKVTSKYMVAFLSGRWNYYINFPDNEEHDQDNYKLHEVKLYSELFKDMHKGNTVPFNGPHISKRLFSPSEWMDNQTGPSKSWTSELESISMAIQHIQGISTLPHLAARMEAIIQVDCCLEDGDSTLDLLQNAKHFFRENRDLESGMILKNLAVIQLDRIQMFLQNNLLPFANTLNRMVRHHISCKKDSIWSELGPDDFYTAMSAECALRIGFYGTDFRHGGQPFPEIVRDGTGLRTHLIGNREGGQFEDWIFGERIKTISRNDLTFVLAPIPEPIGSNVLLEIGKYFAYDSVPAPSNDLPWNDRIKRLIHLTRMYSEENRIIKKDIDKEINLLASEIYSRILDSGLKFYKKYKFQTRTLKALRLRTVEGSTRKIHPATSWEVAEFVVSLHKKFHRHKFVCYLVRLVLFLLDDVQNGKEQLTKSIANQFESAMMQEGACFNLPVNQDNVICVFPFVGTRSCNFSQLGVTKKEKLSQEILKLAVIRLNDVDLSNVTSEHIKNTLTFFANTRYPIHTNINELVEEARNFIN